MNDLKLTPEQFAEIVRKQKPHLIAIEDHILELKGGYGLIAVELEVRAGKVMKMSFINKDTWLLPKEEAKTTQI